MLIRRSIALLLIAVTTHCVAADENESFAVRVIDEATIGVVRGDDSNAFAAYSKLRKRWSTHNFPNHLTVKPWTLGEFTAKNKNDLVVAFELAGGPVADLVAVDCNGQFRIHKLETALDGELKPVLNGDGVIYYIVDETVFAFSGKTGTWDSYHVPGLPDVRWVDGAGHVPSIREHGFDTESEKGIIIRRPNGIAKFLADKGLWQFIPSDTNASG
jgi:hypothetical protein